mmetsp:Transcript_12832/g.26636  ORF Transcript_12832/g.26636 Transcript_12832/m.26636 type:complete len:323 (+) Transcript_12832:77-1045(+)
MWKFAGLSATAGAGALAALATRRPPEEAPEGRAKTVLVTGGTSGLGLATVRRLAKRGDLVLTCGRDPERVAAANRIENVRALECNLAEEHAACELVHWARDELAGRPLDVLVNNAGMCRLGDPLLAVPCSRLDDVWAVNARAPVMVSQAAWPLMREAESPLLVNVGSTSASSKFSGLGHFMYPVTKTALLCFSNSLRLELGALHPDAKVIHLKTGAFDTKLTEAMADAMSSNLKSYGHPYDQLAEAVHKNMVDAMRHLSPGPPEAFAETLAAVVHPRGGEGSLRDEYSINVSLMEAIVPWLPQWAITSGSKRNIPCVQQLAA